MTTTDNNPFRKIDKKLIDAPGWLPRKPENNEEDKESIEGFGDNIKSAGLSHPIVIKPKKNGRFDLISGSRRIKASRDDELWAKVENPNIDEFDARIKCGSENEQRLPIDPYDRDDFCYDTYKLGIKLKKIKSKKELAKIWGMSEGKLNRYIYAGEERAFKKDDIVINMSNTNALYGTKLLSDTPVIRNKILEMSIDNVLNITDLPSISRNIDNILKSGISEKIVTKVIEMVTEGVNNNGDNKIIYNFDEKQFDDLTSAIVECQPDVRNYITDKKISVAVAKEINPYPMDVRKSVANQQISLEDAREISKIETLQGRSQVTKERLKIKEWAQRADDVFQNKWDETVSIRQQQDIDVRTTGDTVLKTEFDIQYQRKLDYEEQKASYYDENSRKRLQKLLDDFLLIGRVASPTNITKKEIKEEAIKLVLEINRLSRLLLIDLGQIKNVGSCPNTDFMDADWSAKDSSSDNNANNANNSNNSN